MVNFSLNFAVHPLCCSLIMSNHWRN